MKNTIKPIGMIPIKGINDKAYAKYIASLKPSTPKVMVSIVKNRW